MSYSLALPLPLWNRSASRNSPLASSTGAPGIGSMACLSGIAAANRSTSRRMRSRARSGISSIASADGMASMIFCSMASMSAADISFICAAVGISIGNASLTIRLMNSGDARYQPTATTTTAPAAIAPITSARRFMYLLYCFRGGCARTGAALPCGAAVRR